MAIVDYTTWTETDPNSRITVTSNRVTYTGVARNEDAYVYKDYGAAVWNGSFTHKFTGYIQSSPTGTGVICQWLLSNRVDDMKGLQDGGDNFLVLQVNTDTSGAVDILIRERYASTYYSGTTYSLGAASTPITRYFTIRRDESVGTYGTLYLDIYTDSARTTNVHSTSITLHALVDFQYLFTFDSNNSGVTDSASGYVEDLDYTYSQTGDGGGIVGGTVDYTRITSYSATGGAIVGGGATISQAIFYTSDGGGIVGGNADYSFNGGGSYTMDGGGIAGGSADYTRVSLFSSTGGAVAGGTAPYSFTIASNVQEVIWELYDATTGDPITGVGASTTIKFRRTPDGKIYDWADSTFKSSGWTSITSVLSEKDSTNLAGLYVKEIDVATLDDGRYQIFVGYTASSPKQRGSIEFLIKDGAVWDVHTSDNVDTTSSSILTETQSHPTLAEMLAGGVAKEATLATTQTDITSVLNYAIAMSKWKNNKMVRTSVVGTTETWVLYEDDSTTPALTWTRNTSTQARTKAT